MASASNSELATKLGVVRFEETDTHCVNRGVVPGGQDYFFEEAGITKDLF